jgi:hypothetical protein
MSKWRFWFTELSGILLVALWAVWPFHAQGRAGFIIRFAVVVVIVSIGRAMSYFQPGAFLAVKIVYAIGFALIFRYFNIAFAREDYAFSVFAAGLLFLVTVLPPRAQRARVRFSAWFGAMTRTLRRLRGDHTEEDERFFSELTNKPR